MSKKPYTSDMTEFLKELDQTIKPDSKSRQTEKSKYAGINAKRDNPEVEDKESGLWKGF